MDFRENIVTTCDKQKVLAIIEEELKPYFSTVKRYGEKIEAKGTKKGMFINGYADINVLKNTDGYEIVTSCKTSSTMAYWFWLIIGFFIFPLWLVPLFIMINNRNVPNDLIQKAIIGARSRITG